MSEEISREEIAALLARGSEEITREEIESMNRWNDYVNGKAVEPMTIAEPCSDAISRQAVLGLAYDMSEIDGEHLSEPCMVVDVEDIQKLPPVTPKPRSVNLLQKIGADIYNLPEGKPKGYRDGVNAVWTIVVNRFMEESEEQA